MVERGEVAIDPAGLGASLSSHPAVLGEYVCRLTRRGGRDGLLVMIEVAKRAIDDPKVAVELAALLQRELGVDVDVETVPEGGTAMYTQIEARKQPLRLLDERSL